MTDFFRDSKRNAILGLVGCIILVILLSVFTFNTFDYSRSYDTYSAIFFQLSHLYILGLLIYFIIVLCRFNGKKGSIKFANYLLLISFILSILLNFFIYFLKKSSNF